ncbi:MAG: hypothetical protein AAFP90_07010, partial [Planctomycetota bacterium]
VYDTAGSRLLDIYMPDLAGKEECRRMMNVLRGMFNEVELQREEERVNEDMDDLAKTQRLLLAIRDRYGLYVEEGRDVGRPRSDATESGNSSCKETREPDGGGNRGGELFTTLFGDVGIPANEIRIIATATMLFFVIPPQSSVRDSRAAEFYERKGKFAHWQFGNFPGFTHLRPVQIDDGLVSDLAAATGQRSTDVRQEICRCIGIVSRADFEKYIVHDVWGHSWQASLMAYDLRYQKLASYADPLTLDSIVTSGEGGERCFQDAFEIRSGTVSFHEAGFEAFVDALVMQRLPIALTPVIAEILADVAEFKLAVRHDIPVVGPSSGSTREGERQDVFLPSGSPLEEEPAKLDFLVQDLKFYFRQATKSLRLLVRLPARQERLVQALCQRGANEESARQALDAMCDCWQALQSFRYSDRVQWHEEEHLLRVNVIARLSLNFLGLHREVVLAYRALGERDHLHDLMLLGIAVYFEMDPAHNLWTIDEFVAMRLRPWLDQLRDAFVAHKLERCDDR